jgi:CPA1 family monovalent cation:H+ antiporter
LAKDFPHRDVLVNLTFGVVILSIFAQGLSMAPLLRWLGVVRKLGDRRAYDLRRGQMVAVQAALDSLDEAARTHAVAPATVAVVRQEYQDLLHSAESEMGRIYQDQAGLRDEVLAGFRRYLAAVERNAIGQAARRGLIANEAARELTAAVDVRLASLGEPALDEDDP